MSDFSVINTTKVGEIEARLASRPIFNANKLQNVDIDPLLDDASNDKTVEIAKYYTNNIFSFPKNIGKGSALKKGFQLFLSRSSEPYVLCMDADLQHSAGSIKDFILAAKKFNSKVVIGQREINLAKMPFLRYLSNKITSFILSYVCGQKIKDSQCGFRLINRSVLENLELNENGFQLESEFLIRCAQMRIPLTFINIPTIYNSNGSNIHHFSDTFKFIRLIINEF